MSKYDYRLKLMKAALKTRSSKFHLSKSGKYVLFGFCRSDVNEVGYLAKIPHDDEDEVIADDLERAMRFDCSNVDSAVEFVNEEFKEIYGPHAYAFHKVKVIE